jgi:hypothetical protein
MDETPDHGTGGHGVDLLLHPPLACPHPLRTGASTTNPPPRLKGKCALRHFYIVLVIRCTTHDVLTTNMMLSKSV